MLSADERRSLMCTHCPREVGVDRSMRIPPLSRPEEAGIQLDHRLELSGVDACLSREGIEGLTSLPGLVGNRWVQCKGIEGRPFRFWPSMLCSAEEAGNSGIRLGSISVAPRRSCHCSSDQKPRA